MQQNTKNESEKADRGRYSFNRIEEIVPTLGLSHSVELLESILESVGSGVIVANTRGEILLFNAMASKILGLSATTAHPVQWPAVYGLFQADRKSLLCEEDNPMLRAINGESVDKLELYVRNRAVPWGLWCSVNARPLIDKEGIKTGGVLVLEDITEKKKLSEELARSNKDLQQFAYVAAHDLQEPIRSIIGFSEILEARLKDTLDEKSEDQFKRVLAAAKRMQKLIGALLAFARVETRAKAPEPCDCNEALADAIADLSSTIEKTGASVTSEALPEILADQTQITQLFQNLIANSLKYRSAETPVINIKVSSNEQAHTFAVSDNGMGIDMRFAERIFIIFQRLHNKTEYEGAGVGLALCKKIVERHHGEIWLESEPGKGATFYFSIPVLRRSEHK